MTTGTQQWHGWTRQRPPVNISLEPENKICIVCANVVPALVEVTQLCRAPPQCSRPPPAGARRGGPPAGAAWEGPPSGAGGRGGTGRWQQHRQWELGTWGEKGKKGKVEDEKHRQWAPHVSWSREKGKFVKCVVDPTCQASRL
jgi:hypothetical protein